MKKIITICICLLAFVSISKAQTAPAEFKFEKETHDFGKLPIGTPASYEFKFTNVGEQPLTITKAETTSGTVATFTQTAINKGESGIIKVTFSPAGQPMPFSKTIKIISNAKIPTKVLYIKGETTN